MEFRRLGRSGLLVSDICFGTMTFGSTVEEAESMRLLDMAYDGGVNFYDTAEMYAVPPRAETYGASEVILGKWLANKPRELVIVATKIAGPNGGTFGSIVSHIRGGHGSLDWHHFESAVEGSLKRLGVDYIDLYQTHWPDRTVPMEAQLEAFDRLIEAGKVRYAGASNENAWGLTRFAALSETSGLPAIVSLQNVYHLLKRDFDGDVAEVCQREEIGMMAFSPIATGILTGKYSGGALPEGSRLATYPQRFRDRYGHPRALAAADRYVAIAKEAGIDPAAMAVAWVRGRPGVTSALPGATRPEHVDAILAGGEITLSDDVLAAIEAVHTEFKNPVV
ncbi:MAG: aldo/keto reductase [Alphaproteobacteria bacterium]